MAVHLPRLRLLVFYVAVTIAVLGAGMPSALARTWKSADGKYSIEAELVRQGEKTVTLKKTNGQVITVPLGVLSDADRAFLKEQNTPAGGDASAPEDEARKALETAGLKVRRSGLELPEEEKLEDGLKETFSLRTELNKAAQALANAEQQLALHRQRINQLTQLNVRLNAQLARINPNDISTNNKLVGALQANDGQIKLLEQAVKDLEEQERAARGAYNDAREKYVQRILDLRKLANSIKTQYAQLASNPEIRQAVADLNSATGKSHELAASRGFLADERRLKSLEDTVLSETIPLRRDGADSFWVSVVVNGEHTQEMIIDSGASLVVFPQKTAKACGIEVDSQGERIILVLADGSRIEATEITVPSLRVGKFTVENVRCAVLDADATEAEPLLGLSFLREFRFEIDTQRATLKMVKVDEDGGSRLRK